MKSTVTPQPRLSNVRYAKCFTNQSPWKAWRWRYKRLLKGGNYFETKCLKWLLSGVVSRWVFAMGTCCYGKFISSFFRTIHKNRCRPPKRASLHSGVIPSDWAPYKKQCIRWWSISWRIAFCIMRIAIILLPQHIPAFGINPAPLIDKGNYHSLPIFLGLPTQLK